MQIAPPSRTANAGLSRHHRRHPADGGFLHRRGQREIFLPVFRMNFPEILDIALPAKACSTTSCSSASARNTRGRPTKMHGLWGMGQMMFSKYIVVVDAAWTSTTRARSCSASGEYRSAARQHLHQKPVRRVGPREERNPSGTNLGIDATRKCPVKVSTRLAAAHQDG